MSDSSGISLVKESKTRFSEVIPGLWNHDECPSNEDHHRIAKGDVDSPVIQRSTKHDMKATKNGRTPSQAKLWRFGCVWMVNHGKLLV
jgi:hypothetical protein